MRALVRCSSPLPAIHCTLWCSSAATWASLKWCRSPVLAWVRECLLRCDEALERFERVILVGSDCPGLDDAYLAQAVDSLQQASVVLGPAEDGGYVLIGARQVSREMFAAIDWGSSQVYAQTLARLQDIGCDWLSLPAQVDIDRPEDIVHWESLRDSTV